MVLVQINDGDGSYFHSGNLSNVYKVGNNIWIQVSSNRLTMEIQIERIESLHLKSKELLLYVDEVDDLPVKGYRAGGFYFVDPMELEEFGGRWNRERKFKTVHVAHEI